MKFIVSTKNLLFLDASGALITTLLLFVLAQFEDFIGMPKQTLYVLMIPAVLLAGFSGSAALFSSKNQKRFLRAVAVANALYCAVTLALVIYFFENLSIWGVAYFVGETFVIGFLVRLEWRQSSENQESRTE